MEDECGFCVHCGKPTEAVTHLECPSCSRRIVRAVYTIAIVLLAGIACVIGLLVRLLLR